MKLDEDELYMKTVALHIEAYNFVVDSGQEASHSEATCSLPFALGRPQQHISNHQLMCHEKE